MKKLTPFRTRSKKNSGFTLAELLVVTAILGVTSYYTAEYAQGQRTIAKQVQVAEDFKALQHAYNQFYTEFRRSPNDLNELVTGGYYTGTLTSPYGTQYVGGDAGQGYSFTVDTNDAGVALNIGDGFGSATVVNDTVTLPVPVPSLGTIASQFLHREAILGSPELNEMQTNLDMSGYDITNVASLDSVTVNTDTVQASTAVIDTLNTVNMLQFGANSIGSSGGTLSLQASRTIVNGTLVLNGDMDAQGGSLSGFNHFDGNSANFLTVDTTSLDANVANIDTLNSDTVNVNDLTSINFDAQAADIDNAVFNTASGQQVTVRTAVIDALTAQSATIQNANVTTLTADVVNGTTATIGDVYSNTVVTTNLDVTGVATLTNANVNVLNATTGNVTNLAVTNGNITTATVGALAANDGYFSNVSAGDVTSTGTASFQDLSTANASISNATITNMAALDTLIANTASYYDLDANVIAFVDVSADTANLNSLTVNGTLDADTGDVDTLTARNGIVDALTVTGTTTVDAFSANSLDLTGALNTNSLSTSTATVTGTATIANANINTLNMSQLTISDIAANDINVTNVSGTNISGTTFTASGDFVTGAGNSVNNNKALYDSVKTLWDSCVAANGCQ